MSKFSLLSDMPIVSPVSSDSAIGRLRILVIMFCAVAAIVGVTNAGLPYKAASGDHLAGKVGMPASSEAKARCAQLYETWSYDHANEGSSAWGAHMGAARAIEDCERGDTANGTAELERLLRVGETSPPPVHTTAAR